MNLPAAMSATYPWALTPAGQAFRHGAEGALAATLFHEERLRISELKAFLAQEGIEVRP